MQRQFTAIRLNFHHSVHLGSHREEYDRSDSILHSDTLYSAIIAAWKALDVEHPVLEYTAKTPPDLGFAISSLFPFFRKNTDEKPVYFFPMPKSGLNVADPRPYRDVRWLSTAPFKHYLKTGEITEASGSIKGPYLTTSADVDPAFMQSDIHPRAYVPRLDEVDKDGKPVTETDIYYIERLFFKEYCGLFGLATFDNDDIRAKVMLALDYLQDAGIGTDRNVGHGQFHYETEGFTQFDDLPESDHSLNLSMFLPESKTQLGDMLASDHCRHELIKRGGWLTTWPNLTYRKNSVYMFREGGVFKMNLPLAGRTVDLRPGALQDRTPVLRVGRSVFLPVKA